MPKKAKGPRGIFALKCSVCGSQNYITQKNRTNTVEKMSFKKYCRKCRKHLVHKETTKLK